MKSFRIFLTLLAASSLASAQQYQISTVAGVPGVQGYFGDGAAATSAQLDKPLRVALDGKGNYYIADYYNHVVRMVTASSGNISTIAGNGAFGFAGDNDTATSANLTDVHGIAVDSSGNVFIADTSNNRIRKIDTKGIISTFAGNGTRGYSGDGMAAASAALWFPAGIAFDSSGNLYVADYGNSTVRKITSSGTISTVAGTGTYGFSGDGGAASKAALASPLSITVDGAGNIYVGDTGNNNIRRIGTDGNIKTVASNVSPQSLAVDAAGNIYFVDGISSTVQKVLQTGSLVIIAGGGQAGLSGDGGAGTDARLDSPNGLALDAAGDVFVADTNNEIIRELKPVAFSVGAVANAASAVQGGVSPGEIVTLFGTGIGPANLTQFTVANGFIGTQIAGTQVFFNGVAAPLLYASSNLVAAIAPYSLANVSSADIVVSYQGNNSATTTVPVLIATPGIFTADSTGAGQAAAVNSDGTLNGAAHPAKVGSFISLYITGAGQTTPAGIDGKIASLAPYPQPILSVKVNIGGQPAVVGYAGAVPTLVAGITQLNVQIPAGIQTGNAVPVQVQVGGISAQAGGLNAQSGVTIAVQ